MPILRGNAGRETDRLEAFSDAIIAIAITLLVLEIHVPERPEEDGSNTKLWHELGDLWPSYFGFAVSFIVIGIMWANHHEIFRYITRATHNLILFNTLFLFLIAMAPFPTALLAEYLGHDGEKTATIVYSGWFLVTAIAYNMLLLYPRKAGLIADDADPAVIAQITRRFNLGPPSYLLAFLVAFISPMASLIISAGLAILYAWPPRGNR
ncbi:TMEM175 family protein [soil metagenome]